jgi:hypothetical protein
VRRPARMTAAPPVVRAGNRRPSSRTAGHALASTSLALILAATLVPAPVGPPVTFGHWCIVCGGYGTADVINNVLLFVPFGAGLGLAGVRLRSAVLAALAATLSIELLQLTVVPGRHATLGDVLMNVAGGALGFALARHGRSLLFPPPRLARALTLASSAVFLAVLWATGWAMLRDPSAGPPAPVPVPPPLPEVQWYNGTVPRATLDGRSIARPDRFPVAVAAALPAAGGRLDAWVTPSNIPLPRFEFFAVVYDPARRAQLILGRRDRDLVFRVRTRSALARLRHPAIVVRDAFPPGGTEPMDRVTHVAGTLDGHLLRAGIERDGTMEWHAVRLSPTLGWAFLLPFHPGLSEESVALTVLWLWGLTLPAGYWAARWQGAGHRPAWTWAVALALVPAVGLALLPALGGFASGGPTDWTAAILGLATGWAAGRRSWRTHPAGAGRPPR